MNNAVAQHGQPRSLLRVAAVTVPLVLLLGLLSGEVSNSGYENAWFSALEKPATMPPGWAFGVAWTTLYILLGLALGLVLASPRSAIRRTALLLFGIQLLLNYAWSPLFFGARQIVPGLALIVAIFAAAAVTAYLFAKVRRAAGLLMLPYLAWLLFAASLNYQIMLLNPGG